MTGRHSVTKGEVDPIASPVMLQALRLAIADCGRSARCDVLGSWAAGLDLVNVERAETIDAYIAGASPQVRPVLRKIRALIRKAAPDAKEVISYRMPAFRQNGILLYFAAFKNHIGMFPPVRGDEELENELKRYCGPKGNLRFPLNEPLPYELIARIATLRVAQDTLQAPKSKKRKS